MFQGIRELKAAPGRSALITLTVGMITVLVTFLSSLAGGLSYESVSALQHRLGSDDALVLQDNGSTSLSASQLSTQQLRDLGGQPLFFARDRVDNSPIAILTSDAVAPGTAEVPSNVAEKHDQLLVGGTGLRTQRAEQNFFFDHLPAVFISTSDANLLSHPSSAAVLPASALSGDGDTGVAHTVALTGSDRWEASASYAGEQMSLNLMINLLYVISALVLGAFFMVWTMQRLRGVTISAALGASRAVLLVDALGQAAVVLAVGVIGGVGLTFAGGLAISSALPITLDASTLVQPAVILSVAGVLGAALSLRPVLRISPRQALASA